jgi:hypothetical protein
MRLLSGIEPSSVPTACRPGSFSQRNSKSDVPSACSAGKAGTRSRIKYSEVMHANKKFDESACGRGSSANTPWRHGQCRGRAIREQLGTRYGRRYLRKIGSAYRISCRQDHLRLARSAHRPIAGGTSLLHGWSLLWRTEERRNL